MCIYIYIHIYICDVFCIYISLYIFRYIDKKVKIWRRGAGQPDPLESLPAMLPTAWLQGGYGLRFRVWGLGFRAKGCGSS